MISAALADTEIPMTLTSGETATFRVEAASEEPLRYQWRRNGKDVPGANDAEKPRRMDPSALWTVPGA